MTLAEAVSQLAELDIDATLCVRRPWTALSECRVLNLDITRPMPAELRAEGMEYFLENHVAQEVLGVFGDRRTSLTEKVALLIFYAENDAYPEWVYSD